MSRACGSLRGDMERSATILFSNVANELSIVDFRSDRSSLHYCCVFVLLCSLQLTHKQNAVEQERRMLEMEGDGRASCIAFDVFEWVFQWDATQPKGAYIYQ